MAKLKVIILALLVILVAGGAGSYAAIHYMQTRAAVQVEKDKQLAAKQAKQKEEEAKAAAQKEKERQKQALPQDPWQRRRRDVGPQRARIAMVVLVPEDSTLARPPGEVQQQLEVVGGRKMLVRQRRDRRQPGGAAAADLGRRDERLGR